MANVTVLFFSYAADRMSGRQASYDLPEGMTIGAFFSTHVAPKLRESMESMMFSINEEWAPPDYVLQDGDRLAVIPPVSGG
ncbi:MoaD/ThiS family protein [Sulfobacillus harzensis]|uniref:Molybdopterin synthase sulfur carrier subunit n=1 Tax=Sulfobacillus harzensis TaxID=2729629 RepID=A0A7Y0L353_9FIRM|nr:MoaD/ThiS family protein [Sulfobacillus harzensis]NMP22117.1 MoaD/ThiS family protein [Sulfobacillus harzensis]